MFSLSLGVGMALVAAWSPVPLTWPRAPADLLAIVLSYGIGALPFGLLLVRWFKGIDVRSVGSGNIGATNAMRAGGKPLGLAVFALDVLKGYAAVALLAPRVGAAVGSAQDVLQVACGAAAVLGHCFPIYLRFRGGKGVATGCGALIALDARLFLAGGAVWLAVLFTTRFAGLASMLMGLAFPVAAWYLEGAAHPERVVGASLLALLILVRHRSNIARMLAGTEPKVFSKRPAAREVEP